MIYKDRRGAMFTPLKDDIIRPRKGAFSVFVYNDHILLNTEGHAPDIPELPGGGIDEGETALQAAAREFAEETGMNFPDLSPVQEFQQDVKFYADDNDEYWDYHQTFFLFDQKDVSQIYFQDYKKNPDGYHCFWLSLTELESAPIHFFHKQALRNILKEIELI